MNNKQIFLDISTHANRVLSQLSVFSAIVFFFAGAAACGNDKASGDAQLGTSTQAVIGASCSVQNDCGDGQACPKSVRELDTDGDGIPC